jgi:SAM-dependent methyltransferase
MIQSVPNSYSPHWFAFFHTGIPEERTQREVALICECAPLSHFQNILDLCCGGGRHARALAARGYTVTGVERDEAAVTLAREMAGGPRYIHADIRDYQPDQDAYDLAIVMSQTFGHFDAAANRNLLRRLIHGVRDGGRIILDVWNPEFFAAHQRGRDLETAAGTVREDKSVKDGRLLVRLTYPDGTEDSFNWQLFTPEEMRSMAELTGAALVVACTNFNAGTKPQIENPRIQFVLERS